MKIKGSRIQALYSEPLDDVVLWTDTMPQSVVLQCLTTKLSELRVWNYWRDERNVTQAWIGNAGMVIEESNGLKRLLCNSPHELTFWGHVLELESVS